MRAGSAAIDAGTDIGLASCGSPDQGAFETCGPQSATIDGRFLDVTFETVAPPLQPLSGPVGWSVSCTGAGCGTPSVAAVTVLESASNTARLDIAGIAADACSAGQTWTVSFDSEIGELRDSARIGGALNQTFHSIVDLAVSNDCSGSAGESSGGSDGGSDGGGTDTNAASDSNGGDGSGGTADAASEGDDTSAGVDANAPGGCGCSTPRRADASWLAFLAAITTLQLRRRRAPS